MGIVIRKSEKYLGTIVFGIEYFLYYLYSMKIKEQTRKLAAGCT